MMHIKSIYNLFTILFSELIWIYSGIVMFTSIDWQRPAFFDLTWLVMAGVMGYILNLILAKRNQYISLAVNIAFIGGLIIQNWRSTVPEGYWGFGLMVSIGLIIIFIRSLILTGRQPTRVQMLGHFEKNILFYIFFSMVFTINKWINQEFHLLYIFAIVMSLIGITLSLQSYEQNGEHEITEIRKVGQSGWFTGVFILLFIFIPLISLILFLPAVRETLYSLGNMTWEAVQWLGTTIGNFLNWLVSLLPEPKPEAGPPPGVPGKDILEPKQQEVLNSPYILIIGIILIGLIVLGGVWILLMLIRNRQPSQIRKTQYISITKESLWKNLLKKLKTYLHNLKVRWCMRFPYLYYHSVYWYYYQLQRWGEKNGFRRNKSETSKEYVNKVISHIPEKVNNFKYENKNYYLSELLIKLNKDYQSTYYGTEVKKSKAEYKVLINHLRGIRLKGIKIKEVSN